MYHDQSEYHMWTRKLFECLPRINVNSKDTLNIYNNISEVGCSSPVQLTRFWVIRLPLGVLECPANLVAFNMILFLSLSLSRIKDACAEIVALDINGLMTKQKYNGFITSSLCTAPNQEKLSPVKMGSNNCISSRIHLAHGPSCFPTYVTTMVLFSSWQCMFPSHSEH